MKISVFKLIEEIESVMRKKASDFNTIIDDLKLSKYKIRAIQGDLNFLVKTNHDFIESLWRINKVNTIVDKNIDKLEKEDKQILFNYLNRLQTKARAESLTRASKSSNPRYISQILKIEIIKDKSKVN